MNLKVRRTDPITSVEAAESVQHKNRASQRAVLAVLRQFRHGATDSELIRSYYFMTSLRGSPLPRQSESGIRTRRKELVEKGLVEDTGRTDVLPSGRRSIIWKVSE